MISIYSDETYSIHQLLCGHLAAFMQCIVSWNQHRQGCNISAITASLWSSSFSRMLMYLNNSFSKKNRPTLFLRTSNGKPHYGRVSRPFITTFILDLPYPLRVVRGRPSAPQYALLSPHGITRVQGLDLSFESIEQFLEEAKLFRSLKQARSQD